MGCSLTCSRGKSSFRLGLQEGVQKDVLEVGLDGK